VLGEGERPLLDLVARRRAGLPLGGIAGTAERNKDGQIIRIPAACSEPGRAARNAIYSTPYDKDAVFQPIGSGWNRLYRIGALAEQKPREKRTLPKFARYG